MENSLTILNGNHDNRINFVNLISSGVPLVYRRINRNQIFIGEFENVCSAGGARGIQSNVGKCSVLPSKIRYLSQSITIVYDYLRHVVALPCTDGVPNEFLPTFGV